MPELATPRQRQVERYLAQEGKAWVYVVAPTREAFIRFFEESADWMKAVCRWVRPERSSTQGIRLTSHDVLFNAASDDPECIEAFQYLAARRGK